MHSREIQTGGRSGVFTKKRRRGSVAMEVAITFPILCNLIFFMLELIKINDVRISVEAAATEIAFEFMASKNTAKIQPLINKYKPIFIRENEITWYFDVYDSLEEMSKNTAQSYVGEVIWPGDNQNSGSYSGSDYVDTDRNGGFSQGGGTGRISFTDYKMLTSSPSVDFSGKAFVVTVVCDYPFNSDFLKRLFGGGRNTPGSKFLLWGRSVGVCS
ncbi:MAG: pilus assembly protein [Holosporaceae bacterium]|jgi:hypothetical protein|nr:pilus assembly protein [Holosporaceae bacterium]